MDMNGDERLDVTSGAYWYEAPAFTRYPIAYNSTAGAGSQFVAVDFEGDGDKDILCAGQTGQYWFENLSIDEVPQEQREKELLYEGDWPFPD